MFDDSDECATAAELGDFEFERKFLLGAMPPEAAGDPSPDLIVQAYVFADDGFAVRVRISGPVDGIDVDASPRAMAQALTEHPDSLGTLGAKGPANAGTRYEAERQIDALVAGSIVARSTALIAKVRYSMWLGEDGWVVDLPRRQRAVARRRGRAGPPGHRPGDPRLLRHRSLRGPALRQQHLAHHPFPTWAKDFAQEYRIMGPGFMQSLGRNRFDGEPA